MEHENIVVFCFVIGLVNLMFNGLDVEASVAQNVRKHDTDDTYPFIDGLRINTQRPVIDTSDLEEPDTNGYPFIDGLRKIPRRFELSSIDLDEGTVMAIDRVSPFRNGLRKNIESSVEFESIFDIEDKIANDGNFPFIDGLRKPESEPESNFEKSNEEYPFIDRLRRHPRSMKKSKRSLKSIEDFSSDGINSILKSTSDNDSSEHPLFIGGIACKDSQPIKKRSLGAVVDDTAFLEERRDQSHVSSKSAKEGNVDASTSSKADSHSIVNGTGSFSISTVHEDSSHVLKVRSIDDSDESTKPMRLQITIGERKPGDSELMYNVYKKPILFNFTAIESEVFSKYPEANEENKCPINYILVKNAQTVGELEDEEVRIISGGIGQTHVTVVISSPTFFLCSYSVTIYGVCPK